MAQQGGQEIGEIRVEQLRQVLDKAFDRVFARVARDAVSERTAAMAIGVERVRDAKATRGLFP